jgi:hypothetical protein
VGGGGAAGKSGSTRVAAAAMLAALRVGQGVALAGSQHSPSRALAASKGSSAGLPELRLWMNCCSAAACAAVREAEMESAAEAPGTRGLQLLLLAAPCSSLTLPVLLVPEAAMLPAGAPAAAAMPLRMAEAMPFMLLDTWEAVRPGTATVVLTGWGAGLERAALGTGAAAPPAQVWAGRQAVPAAEVLPSGQYLPGTAVQGPLQALLCSSRVLPNVPAGHLVWDMEPEGQKEPRWQPTGL